MDIAGLFASAGEHDIRALSRLLSAAESAGPPMAELGPLLAGSAASGTHIVGITGAPGTGKSTLTSALVSVYRGQGLRVAVLAVDPSSPYTGGALLGDRIRMLEHSDDDGVFIRSMASRGHLGGLAAASMTAISILSVTGFDVLLVETVGAGQSEIEIVRVTDTTVVVVNPNAGDGVQAVKAGIFEIADIFAVNKADQPNADLAVRELRGALRLSPRAAGGWAVPVVASVASRPGGAGAVADAIAEHRRWLDAGARARRRRAFTAQAIRRLAIDQFDRGLTLPGSLVDQVQRGDLSPWEAAQTLTN